MERIPKAVYTPEFRAEAVKLVVLHDAPVAVLLAVLLPGRRAQKHVGANLPAPTLFGHNQGLHYTRFPTHPADRLATNQ